MIDLTGNVAYDFGFQMIVLAYMLGWFWGVTITTFKRLFR